MNNPIIIGISGKPGSAKNYFSFKLIQEIRYQGYIIDKVSLTTALYQEVNQIIDDIKSKIIITDFIIKHNMTVEEANLLYQLVFPNDVGDKNPEYGYNRRNETVRKTLTLVGSTIRRAQNENYWIEKLFNQPTHADFLIFTDMRFPNEADYVNKHDGITIRAEINKHWVAATQTANDGYKYSEEGMNDQHKSLLGHSY